MKLVDIPLTGIEAISIFIAFIAFVTITMCVFKKWLAYKNWFSIGFRTFYCEDCNREIKEIGFFFGSYMYNEVKGLKHHTHVIKGMPY